LEVPPPAFPPRLQAIADEMATMRQGARTDLVQNCTISIDDTAKVMDVSPRYVKTVRAIRKVDPALAEDVKQGRTKLAKAVKIVEAKKATPVRVRSARA
jgi:ribosome-interacting GTPase 1